MIYILRSAATARKVQRGVGRTRIKQFIGWGNIAGALRHAHPTRRDLKFAAAALAAE